MAKRKRLTPPLGEFLASANGDGRVRPAPIARIAGDAATVAALQEVSDELASARAEGRLIQRLPLEAVEVEWLVRDRVRADSGQDEDMDALVSSLQQHGQRTPIDVVLLETGRFGLISGWRRISALKRLLEETGDDRFGHVLATLRTPAKSEDAYVAMVEENEIRLGLSYYERARIAAKAVEAGIFPTERQALNRLFASASRARRSKIGSFLTLYHLLGSHLRHPEALSERQGLALARLLNADPMNADRVVAQLSQAPIASSDDERAALTKFLEGMTATTEHVEAPSPSPPTPSAPSVPSGERQRSETPAQARVAPCEEIQPGIFLEHRSGRIVLSGDAVGPHLVALLREWLRTAADDDDVSLDTAREKG